MGRTLFRRRACRARTDARAHCNLYGARAHAAPRAPDRAAPAAQDRQRHRNSPVARCASTLRKRLLRIEHDGAIERISGIYRLDLHERCVRLPARAPWRAWWPRARGCLVPARKARSAALASRRLSENARSPPRMPLPFARKPIDSAPRAHSRPQWRHDPEQRCTR